MVATFIQNGCGVGFVPDFIFAKQAGVEEVILKVPLIEYEICVFKLKKNRLSRAAKAIIAQWQDS